MPSKLTKWAFKAEWTELRRRRARTRSQVEMQKENVLRLKCKCVSFLRFFHFIFFPLAFFFFISPYIWHLSALCIRLLLLLCCQLLVLMLGSLRNESNLNFLIVRSSGRPKAKVSNYYSECGVRRSFCDFAHNNNLNNVPGIDDWSAMVATVLVLFLLPQKEIDIVVHF